VAVAALTILVAAIAWADASGKWTWKQRGQGGNEVEWIAEVKQDGEKLTGTVMRAGSDTKTEIKEGTVKGADVSFVTIREFNGNQFKTTYKGKAEGDTIKGERINVRDGQENKTEWVATRAK
jgi:hypothetical protein